MKLGSLTAFALTAVLYAGDAANASFLRATCTEGNKVVNTEDLPSDAGVEEKAIINARYPNAMCIFFEMGTAPDFQAIPEKQEALPSTANAYQGISAPGGMDKDLATALAIISSGQKEGGVENGNQAPVDLSEMMKTFRSTETGSTQQTPPVSNEIALTIGIYKDMEPTDILAHWKQMARESNALKKFMPTLTRAGDVTMLSVEHVPDADANAVCEEAEKMGSSCLAYY